MALSLSDNIISLSAWYSHKPWPPQRQAQEPFLLPFLMSGLTLNSEPSPTAFALCTHTQIIFGFRNGFRWWFRDSDSVCVCMCVCVHVCIHVHTYIHIYIYGCVKERTGSRQKHFCVFPSLVHEQSFMHWQLYVAPVFEFPLYTGTFLCGIHSVLAASPAGVHTRTHTHEHRQTDKRGMQKSGDLKTDTKISNFGC